MLGAVERRKISCSCRIWNPGLPARSPLLYLLNCPGCLTLTTATTTMTITTAAAAEISTTDYSL
jgi:hypothetical protein